MTMSTWPQHGLSVSNIVAPNTAYVVTLYLSGAFQLMTLSCQLQSPCWTRSSVRIIGNAVTTGIPSIQEETFALIYYISYMYNLYARRFINIQSKRLYIIKLHFIYLCKSRAGKSHFCPHYRPHHDAYCPYLYHKNRSICFKMHIGWSYNVQCFDKKQWIFVKLRSRFISRSGMGEQHPNGVERYGKRTACQQ
jgi:hypothetical protein